MRGYIDKSINIRFPDTININEKKAPTDESIRLMEEMHDKAMKNIIAKVKVEDNLINGMVYLIDQQYTAQDLMRIIFKFKINGQEFTIEKEIDRNLFWDKDNMLWISNIDCVLKDRGKAVILWYTLKMFATVAYEQLTSKPFPKELLPQ